MPKEKKETIRKDGKRAVSTRLSVDLLEELDKVCKEFGFTKSGFTERALRKLIAEVRDDSRLF